METIDKASEHFRSVLKTVFEKEAFILVEDDETLVKGSRTTVVFFLSRFVEKFGDLIEADNYSINAYKQRAQELDLAIKDDVFDHWKEKGCLQD